MTLLASRRPSRSTTPGCTKRSAARGRIEKELRFAQRVQLALLPTELRRRSTGRRCRAFERRASWAATSTLPRSETGELVVAVGDGRERERRRRSTGLRRRMVRSRTQRRRSRRMSSASRECAGDDKILHERRSTSTTASSATHSSTSTRRTIHAVEPGRRTRFAARRMGAPDCPAGRAARSFHGVVYDEVTLEIRRDELFVFARTASPKRWTDAGSSSAPPASARSSPPQRGAPRKQSSKRSTPPDDVPRRRAAKRRHDRGPRCESQLVADLAIRFLKGKPSERHAKTPTR